MNHRLQNKLRLALLQQNSWTDFGSRVQYLMAFRNARRHRVRPLLRSAVWCCCCCCCCCLLIHHPCLPTHANFVLQQHACRIIPQPVAKKDRIAWWESHGLSSQLPCQTDPCHKNKPRIEGDGPGSRATGTSACPRCMRTGSCLGVIQAALQLGCNYSCEMPDVPACEQNLLNFECKTALSQ